MKNKFVFDGNTWNADHIKRVGALKQCQGGWYFEIETPLGIFYISRQDFEEIEAAKMEFEELVEKHKSEDM